MGKQRCRIVVIRCGVAEKSQKGKRFHILTI